MNIKGLFFGVTLILTGFVCYSQDCEKIPVDVVVVQENSQSVLKINFEKEADYKIRLIDSKGNVNIISERTIRNLKKGEYDIIIVDEANKNRCPFSKRIKI